MRFITRKFGWLLAAVGAVAFGTAVPAAEYPERPIEFVVPWGPGGGADQLARLVGKLMEPVVGQGVPVVNVPGGTGATGMAKLMSSPADGYSMAVYVTDTHALLTGKDARWKFEDIVPAAVMIRAPSFIFVAQNSRFKTWADFESEARTNPGKLKVATLGFGGVDDFTLRTLGDKGVKVVQVPFSKPAERYLSILGGHADALYEQAGDVASFLSSKQMRPIMIFGEKRSQHFEDVPSSYELGFKVGLPLFRAVVVRAGTPPERVKVLANTLTKIAQTAEYKKFLEDQFADPNSFIDQTKAEQFIKEQLDDMKRAMLIN